MSETLKPNLTLPLVVTGAAGFIGARFVERCNSRGIRVIAVDAPEHFRDRKRDLEAGGPALDFGTIVDREKLFPWLDANALDPSGKPTIGAIVHLGACTDTFELDETYLRKMNLDYARAVWSWCAKHRVALVYASSGATYGAGELGYDDADEMTPRLKPLNPYGESKRAFDEWALGEEKRGHAPPLWAGFKFFNVYGFGEKHKDKMASVIFHSFGKIRAEGRIQLFQSHRPDYRDGEQKRDFIYVEDLVDVLFFALEKPIRRGIFNLGTGRARTWLDLARATFAAMGVPERIEFIPIPEVLRERYQYFTEAKMDRLRAEGYSKPFTPLEDGVRAYVGRMTRASKGP
jgi:ADP-L-glycero-D-manno-heptose 6-epimerase